MIEAVPTGPGQSAISLLFGLRLYNTDLQQDPNVRALKEARRLPSQVRTGLQLGKAAVRNVLPGILGRAPPEDFYRRFPHVYGPNGTWDGGRDLPESESRPRRHRPA